MEMTKDEVKDIILVKIVETEIQDGCYKIWDIYEIMSEIIEHQDTFSMEAESTLMSIINSSTRFYLT